MRLYSWTSGKARLLGLGLRKSRMKKAKLFGAVALLALVSTANAQYNKPSGIAIRGGLFFPSDATAKAEGKTWFGVGLDYKTKDVEFEAMRGGYDTSYTISVDYYSKGDYSNMPIMLNYVSRRDNFYYGGGAGLGYAKTPTAGGTSTNTEMTYQFSVGFEFQKGTMPFFIEGRYWGCAESALTGTAIYAGIKF